MFQPAFHLKWNMYSFNDVIAISISYIQPNDFISLSTSQGLRSTLYQTVHLAIINYTQLITS